MRFSNSLQGYQPAWFSADLLAGLIVAVLITPQSIAYALLAGLPPQAGLYSALLPVAVYAFLGSSRLLAVGPVAIISLMTFDALHQLAPPNTQEYMLLAAALAGLTGLWLLLFWLIDLGRWTTFISQSVISAFTSATALLIVLSQLHHVLGVNASGYADFYHTFIGLLGEVHLSDLTTVTLSCIALVALLLWQYQMPKLTHALPKSLANLINKSGPLLIVTAGILFVHYSGLGVNTVGELPSGLPSFGLPNLAFSQWQQLINSAAIIALICYITSLSASEALTMISKEENSTNNNTQELLALGAANVAAAFTQAFPIAGSFSRSVVNQAAGAKSQLAGLITVLLVLLICVFATGLFSQLPQAILAIIIIASAWPLISFVDGVSAWRFQPSDGLVWFISFFAVLVAGAETGILAGMLLSLALYMKRTSEPHIAEIGRVANSDHFRNVLHYKVTTNPKILMIRIDENLYFANSRYLLKVIRQRMEARDGIKHVVLVGTAINHIDYNGLQTLQLLLKGLDEHHYQLHLAEFKMPVIQQLQHTSFLTDMQPGRLFFNASEALKELSELDH